MAKKIVFVGLSGGVDSAVSAALLQKATPNNFKKLFGRPTPKGFRGFNVVGVFIRTWHPEFLECKEEEERLDAMRVAAHLDIPFLSFDLADVYKKEVADYMIREYKVGRTPNPDVMCNKEVKFGAFLKKALAMGADYVATGHYAGTDSSCSFFSALRPSPEYGGGTLGRLKKGTPAVRLYKGKDETKDQSYFLWTLKQEQLSKIIFPVGHLKKTEVRKLARKFNLPVAQKKDSQGICFLGAVDLKEFLKHYIKEKKGKVLNEQGEEIGYHNGVVFSTLGERHGFAITKKSPNDGAYYVVGKDMKKNFLYVSQDKNYLSKGTDIFLLKNSSCSARPPAQAPLQDNFYLCLNNTNWISKPPEQEKTYTAQIRYHGEFLPCKIICGSKASAEVIFEKPVMVAAGQSVVIYDKDICLGGGVVA